MWFSYLLSKKIDFRIPIKQNTLVPKAAGEKPKAWKLFAFTATAEALVFEKPRTIWGLPLYFSGMRLETVEDLLLVATTFSATPISDYALRCGIETLFGSLK